MIRIICWDKNGMEHLIIADKVQVKTFDKKVKPIITKTGIGNCYFFEDNEKIADKFRKAMKGEQK
jgi:hypothetical protein